MNRFTKLSAGKHVLFMFGTLCAILLAIGALFFFSRQTIERGNGESLSYVVDETELAQAAAQNTGLMQAVIFRQFLATDPIEIELLIAPPYARPR